ncbi:MAG: FHA domain-containing protein [Oscillospiraceae bacterium]|nr:FHA domain-containing protein [Oscillospiraceae bacterium]
MRTEDGKGKHEKVVFEEYEPTAASGQGGDYGARSTTSTGGEIVTDYDRTVPERTDRIWDSGQKTKPGRGFAEYDPTEPSGQGGRNRNTGTDGSGFTDYGPTESSRSWKGSGSEIRDDTPAGIQDFDQEDGRANYMDFDDHGKKPETQRSESGFVDYGKTEVTGSWDRHHSGVTETNGGERGYRFQPVVGWLVCIAGPDRGRDYRIHDNYNSIGRLPNMDICVSDPTISRERHALVAYDPEEKLYYFAPADEKNLVKLNGKVLMNAAELKAAVNRSLTNFSMRWKTLRSLPDSRKNSEKKNMKQQCRLSEMSRKGVVKKLKKERSRRRNAKERSRHGDGLHFSS